MHATTNLTPNGERFREVYEAILLAEIASKAQLYMDTVESAKASNLAGKMTAALAQGRAMFSDTMKKACRQLGIKPTQRDVRAFLNVPATPNPREGAE